MLAIDIVNIEEDVESSNNLIPRKYEFTGETKLYEDKILHQIVFTGNKEIYGLEKGQLGGWIESESNLSHEGDCWISPDTIVLGNVVIKENARILGTSTISSQSDLLITNNVKIINSEIFGKFIIDNNAEIQNSLLSNKNDSTYTCVVSGKSRILGSVITSLGWVGIYNNAIINNSVIKSQHLYVNNSVYITDSSIFGKLNITDSTVIKKSIVNINYDLDKVLDLDYSTYNKDVGHISGVTKIYEGNISSMDDFITIGPISKKNLYITLYKSKINISDKPKYYFSDDERSYNSIRELIHANELSLKDKNRIKKVFNVCMKKCG